MDIVSNILQLGNLAHHVASIIYCDNFLTFLTGVIQVVTVMKEFANCSMKIIALAQAINNVTKWSLKTKSVWKDIVMVRSERMERYSPDIVFGLPELSPCTLSEQCDTGLLCQNGYCTGTLPVNQTCTPDLEYCDPSTYCTFFPPTNAYVCTPRIPNGEPCTFDSECVLGSKCRNVNGYRCDDGSAGAPCTLEEDCKDDLICDRGKI